MATFRKRLPSSRDIKLVFAAIALPVFAWSIVNVLREMPSWVLRLKTWDLIGIIAYTQAFALFETLLVLLALVLVAVVLPRRLFREHFVAVGSSFVTVAALWAIAYHLSPVDIKDMGRRQLFMIGMAAAGSIALVYGLVTRSARVGSLVRAAAERISLLSFVYASLGVLSIVLVIIRNL